MINVKSVKPLFNVVITTAKRFERPQTKNGVVVADAMDYKPYQVVIAIGDAVRGLEVGDLVHIDPIRYAKFYQDPSSLKANGAVRKYEIPTIELDGNECFRLTQADIDYIVEEFEENDEQAGESVILTPGQDIVRSV